MSNEPGEQNKMKNVGFIGLGAMGAGMARNVSKGGFTLSVFNRTQSRSKAFAEQGVRVYDSPANLVNDNDAVIIMVTDPDALDAVLAGEHGVLAGLQNKQAGTTLVINMSTVSPAATLRAAEQVTAAGGRFVDAPVSGTVKPAEDGTLIILAAGEDGDLDQATPLLNTMGKAVVRCGACGQATRMKLVLNLILAGMMQSLAEGLSLAASQNIDGDAVLAALSGGPLGAGLYQMKGGMMLSDNFTKQFPVDLMFKDLNLVLNAAGQANLPLPMTAAIRETFSAARGLGYGDEDMAAVIKVIRHLSQPQA
ncbi:MAG: NAD(P)-dependent oxidoreductase [Gammaproteobacteria bacterium]